MAKRDSCGGRRRIENGCSVKIKKTTLLLAAFLILAGCDGAGKGKKDRREAAAEEGASLPEYVLEGVVHSYYERGTLKLQVTFEKGGYYKSEGKLAVENCVYVYYDSMGKVISRGRSKRAKLFSNEARLVAEEDVVVVSEANGGVLKTGYLEWSGRKNQFTTDDFVTITRTNGDRIAGKGMIADLGLRFVTIERNVKGYFKENKDP
jgi:LPS export ABC transporter protein LptC